MKGKNLFPVVTAMLMLVNFANGECKEVASGAGTGNQTPNVIIIFADDLGYGDLECYGNTKISTPNINQLATDGCRFMHAYVPAGVCTPSRYGLLTGRYPWRTFLKKHVIADKPSLIDPQRYTMPDLFKDAGYVTAAIGKWHLGFTESRDEINYNEPVQPGPNELGFDYFFGLPVGHFFPPYVYMRNHLVVGLDPEDPISIVKPPAGGTPVQEGGENARIVREDVSKVIFEEASSFVIENQANPFFLYLATTKPHTPYDVHDDFRNSGPLSTYGDVIREIDFRVGEFLQLLDSLKLTDHTMVIFSSDNGGVSSFNGYFRDLGIDHDTNYPLRGNKGDVWDGGVRIPFILRYPDLVKPGTTSDVPFCATDLMASVADLLNLKIPSNAGEDSYSVLPALLGTGQVSDHPFVLQGRAGILGLRWGQWKYIPDPGNGDSDAESKLIPPDALPGQLYRITTDTGEQHNLYLKYPEKVQMMDEMLNRIVEGTGRDVY